MPASRIIIEDLFYQWNRVYSKAHTWLIGPCFFSLGKKTTIHPPCKFLNGKRISIGNGVTIDSNAWIQVLPDQPLGNHPIIVIKDHASIGMGATISAIKSIVIEEYVLCARNVYISDHGHAFSDITVPIALQKMSEGSEVVIGAHSWLGQNCVILPGVRIGKHCIIGANSVVNKQIPDYCVCAGAPAKIIKIYNSSSQKWECPTP